MKKEEIGLERTLGLLEFEGERVVVEIEMMGKEGNEVENESDDGDEEGWSFSWRSLLSQQSDADDAQPTQLVIISTSFFPAPSSFLLP